MAAEWLIGVILAVICCIISNIGLNLQKLAHIRTAAKAKEGVKEKPYVKQPLWLLGTGMVWAGALLDFAALSFAAQTVIAPIGSLTLVSNVFVAPYMNGESVSRKDLLATLVIVIGSALSVMFGDHSDSEDDAHAVFAYFTNVTFAVYIAFMIAFITFLFGAMKRTDFMSQQLASLAKYNKQWKRYKKLNRFLYASISGITGAQNVLFAKALSSLARGGFFHMWTLGGFYFILFGLVVTIVLQTRWLNAGLALYDALYMVPVFQSFWIVFSVISGLVVYGEANNMSTLSGCMFLLGIAVTVSGVYVLSQRSGSKREGIERRQSMAMSTRSLSIGGAGHSDDHDANKPPFERMNSQSITSPGGVSRHPSLSVSHIFPLPQVDEPDIDLDSDTDSEYFYDSNEELDDIEEGPEEEADQGPSGEASVPAEHEAKASEHHIPIAGDVEMSTLSSQPLESQGDNAVLLPMPGDLSPPGSARSFTQLPSLGPKPVRRSNSHSNISASASTASGLSGISAKPKRRRARRKKSPTRSRGPLPRQSTLARSINDAMVLGSDDEQQEFDTSTPDGFASAAAAAAAHRPPHAVGPAPSRAPAPSAAPSHMPKPATEHKQAADHSRRPSNEWVATSLRSASPATSSIPAAAEVLPSHDHHHLHLRSQHSHSHPRPRVDTRVANGREERIQIDSPDPFDSPQQSGLAGTLSPHSLSVLPPASDDSSRLLAGVHQSYLDPPSRNSLTSSLNSSPSVVEHPMSGVGFESLSASPLLVHHSPSNDPFSPNAFLPSALSGAPPPAGSSAVDLDPFEDLFGAPTQGLPRGSPIAIVSTPVASIPSPSRLSSPEPSHPVVASPVRTVNLAQVDDPLSPSVAVVVESNSSNATPEHQDRS